MYGLFHDKRHGKAGERPERTGHDAQDNGICEDALNGFLQKRAVNGFDTGL